MVLGAGASLPQPTHVLLSLCCLCANPTPRRCLGLTCSTKMYPSWLLNNSEFLWVPSRHVIKAWGQGHSISSVLNGVAKYSTLSNSKRNAADEGLASGGNGCPRGRGFNYSGSSGKHYRRGRIA